MHLIILARPPQGLSTNDRRHDHYWVTRKKVADASEEWFGLLLAALDGVDRTGWPYESAALDYVVTWPTRVMPDYDNCMTSLKVVTDLLCAPDKVTDKAWRLGILKDDGPRCLWRAPGLKYKYATGLAQTEIIITRGMGPRRIWEDRGPLRPETVGDVR